MPESNAGVKALPLCPLTDIEDGGARGFDPQGRGRDQLFVVRQGEQFFAYRNTCPHKGYEGATMAWRKHAYVNQARDRIVCSGHGAQFDIATGVCVSGPCLGERLKPSEVYLAEDGCLYWKIGS